MLRPANLIAFQARLEPNKPAIVSGDSVVSYGMLEQGTRSVAHRIASFGLPRGSLVALSIEAPGRHLAVGLALERCGLVAAGFAAQADSAALPQVALVLTDKPIPMPGGQSCVVVDDAWFGTMPPGGSPTPEPGPEDAYRIFLAPGTTGVPRPITFTQASAAERVVEISSALEMIGAFDRVLQLNGVISASGYMNTLAALARGKTVYFPTAGQDPLQVAQVYQCQLILCVPRQLSGMVERQQQRYLPLPGLVGIAVEGAAAVDTLSVARSLLCGRLLTVWGLPELPITAAELVGHQDVVPGAVGYLCPWAVGRVIDGAGGQVPPGQSGTLQLRSRAGESSWLATGAQGLITPAGRIILTDDSREALA